MATKVLTAHVPLTLARKVDDLAAPESNAHGAGSSGKPSLPGSSRRRSGGD